MHVKAVSAINKTCFERFKKIRLVEVEFWL